MNKCTLCPRNCNINRKELCGFCGSKEEMIISKVMLHQGEEPYLSTDKDKGSGAIFFSGCNLKCVYCQNYDISHTVVGKVTTPSQLVKIFKRLEKQGAGNIDLVTPTHFADKILEALKIYKPKIPVIYNTSGYESVKTLKSLEGYVDVYLTDFKYVNDKLALKYSKCQDYFEKVIPAIKEMRRQQPVDVFKDGKLIKGVVIRHLVLPEAVNDSIKVLDEIKENFGESTLVSIMSQYTPMGKACDFKELSRPLKKLEYKAVISHAIKLNLKNALIQDLESSGDALIPKFKK